MDSLADRFRRWYDYESDCNAKTLAMLASVPESRHNEPSYTKAVEKMVHLMAARQRWLGRVGSWSKPPEIFPPAVPLAELADQLSVTEAAWVEYLSKLDTAELTRELEWVAMDGRRYRWNVEGILTQLLVHAPYHRGQIAQRVAELGGKAVDTDYVYWSKLAVIDS